MSILRFHWIRHAPPVNPGNICYGADMRVDLSDILELERLAARLPLTAKWAASPLPRTDETAQALYAINNPSTGPIEYHPELREQSFGDWVGLARHDLAQTPEFSLYKADPVNVAPPNGESLNVFGQRVDVDIDQIIANNPHGGDIIIVAHAGTIRAAFSKAAGIPIGRTLKFSVEPLSLSVFSYDSNKTAHGKDPWTVESLNLKA